MCFKQKNRKLAMPLSRTDTLVFIEWLVSERNLKAASINSYLAGIRQLHISKGMDPPELRTELVKLIIKGRANADAITKRRKTTPVRLPITDKVLKLIKECIRQWDQPANMKLMVWAVCAIAFAGSFRIGELLCRTEGSFDPDFDLLTEDVKILNDRETGKERIVVKLKCPKESKKGPETLVDVFQADNDICPVRALKKWRGRVRGTPGLPMFSGEDEKPLTGKKLNEILKKLLSPHFDMKLGSFTTHSFRAGVPSMLAASGASEEEVKASGRWSSRAYEAYLKKPRTTRLKVARKVATFL